MKSFLEKKNQKELLAKYRVALEDVWTRVDNKTKEKYIDQKMVEYCIKHTAVIIPLHGEMIATISKPEIEKYISFGYSNGQGPSYSEMEQNVKHATDDIKNYFIEKNLKNFDGRVHEISDKETFLFGLIPHYTTQNVNNPLRSICVSRSEKSEQLTIEDRENFNEAVKFVRENFIKRMNSWLSKYENKIRVNTYWMDE